VARAAAAGPPRPATGQTGAIDVLLVIGAICLSAVPIGLSVWALLDIVSRPAWAFAFLGRSRTVWVVVTVLGTSTIIGGMVFALWYLVRVRPELRDVEAGRLT